MLHLTLQAGVICRNHLNAQEGSGGHVVNSQLGVSWGALRRLSMRMRLSGRACCLRSYFLSNPRYKAYVETLMERDLLAKDVMIIADARLSKLL